MWQLLGAINRVDDSVERLRADMADKFDQLDDRFVPRREVDARFAEGARDQSDLRARLEQLGAKQDAVDQQRKADRRWAIGVLLTVLGLLLTVLTVALNHL
jgi:hypothetical protein